MPDKYQTTLLFFVFFLNLSITSLDAQSRGDNIFSNRPFAGEREQNNSLSPRQLTPEGQEAQSDNYELTLTPHQRRCLTLEKELAYQWIAKSKTRENLPQINEELDKAHRELRKLKRKAERSDCYEQVFIFGKRLKETRKCLKLGRKIEKLEQKTDQLQDQKRALFSNDNSQEDHLIAQLARNNCGSHYVKEDKRRNPSIFSFNDDDFESDERQNGQPGTILPFATYRTMCVRTCDGFYFPVSFSTLSSRFPKDAAVCQSQCAAPAELFVYKNPGEEIEQMISLEGRPYTELPNAFLFRKEFVNGCSCKTTEYSPEKLGIQSPSGKASQEDSSTGEQKSSRKVDRKDLKPLN